MPATKPKRPTVKAAAKKIQRTAGKASGWSFPDETVVFLSELKVNNNREWFNDNKDRYDELVRKPALAFNDQMCARLEQFTGAPHVAKLFRIHRDVRFSKDKTPYKPHMHILFRAAEANGSHDPAWFFGLESDQLVLGTGIFAFEREALDRFRRRVAGSDGEHLARLLAKLQQSGMRIGEPELKRVPTGYPSDIANAQLLRHKGLTVWSDHPGGPDAAAKSDIIETSAAVFRALHPVFSWLRDV